MDIKLRARLSAYSKVESICGLNSNIPAPDATAAGNVLGVNNSGNYTLFPTVSTPEIDTLFSDVRTITTVTNEEIDTLFHEEKLRDESVIRDKVNTPSNEGSTQVDTVSSVGIDSLFK